MEENCSKQMVSKLEESEVRRVEKLLEEADSYRIRETVTGPTNITVDIQSKTEQVWVVVVGAEVETVSSMVGLLHNKLDKMVGLMVETSGNQKKVNKVLQDLLKVGLVKTGVAGGGAENLSCDLYQ